MKRLLSILVPAVAAICASAQTPPMLQFKLESSGALTLSWPVEKIYPPAPDLLPSYRAEVASELGKWEKLVSVPATGGVARVQFTDLLKAPASFVRVRTALDFSGRSLIGRVLTNGVWDNAEFLGANLFAADLSGSTLLNASLGAADLRKAKLRDVDAAGADLTLARLGGADCTSADLTGANLRFAELSDIDLSFVRLDGADLSGAVLQAVVSSYTRFQSCKIDDLTVMDPALRTIWEMVNGKAAGRNFNQANLSVTDLSGANLTNCTFRSADFSGADLLDVNFSGADLTLANFRFADFRGTIVDGRTIMPAKWRLVWDIINHPTTNRVHANIDLSQGFWVDAVLNHADVHGTSFSGGIFFDPDLNSIFAQAANFSGAQFNGGDLRNCDFRNANFAGALFDTVDMTGANTNGAIFNGAVFRNTTMPDGSVRN